MGTYRKTSEFLLSGEFYTPLIVACSDPANFDDDHRIISSSGIENGEEPPTFKRTRTLWKVEDFVYEILMLCKYFLRAIVILLKVGKQR